MSVHHGVFVEFSDGRVENHVFILDSEFFDLGLEFVGLGELKLLPFKLLEIVLVVEITGTEESLGGGD